MNSHTAGRGFRQIGRHLLSGNPPPSLSSPVHPPEPLSGFPHTVFVPLGIASQEAGNKEIGSSKVTKLISSPLLYKQLV